MEQPSSSGWIKLYRSLEENGHLNMPHVALKVFVFLLLRVNRLPGSGCHPGEGWITYDMIRARCSDNTQGVMPNSTINRALDYLEGNNSGRERYIERVQIKKGGPQKIRILNWDKYQGESSIDEIQAMIQPAIQPQIQPEIHKQEEREEDNGSSSPPSAEKPKRTRRKSGESTAKKLPDEFNVAARPLVERLDNWQKRSGAEGVSDWAAAIKTMANALKGSAGNPKIPPAEMEKALEWGAKDPWWKPKLLVSGAKVARDVWAQWKTGGRPSFGGNRYQDPIKKPTAGESVYDEEGDEEDDTDG